MKTVARLKTFAITDEHRKTLAKILGIECGSDLMKKTEAAIMYAYALADPPSTSTDLTDLKANLKSLKGGLHKIQNSFEKIQHTLRFMDNDHFIDDHYCIANDGDTYLMHLAKGGQSGFGEVVNRLLNAVRDFESESCITAGKGRTHDTRFTHALVGLADFFTAAFPDRELSRNRGTVFANFAGWFLQLHPGMTSPRRHIETALAARETVPQK